jgi:hypothetical protein
VSLSGQAGLRRSLLHAGSLFSTLAGTIRYSREDNVRVGAMG